MAAQPTPVRSVLLAGATGLIGTELLAQLQAEPRVGALHVLVRRAPPPGWASPRVVVHTVDFAALPAPMVAVNDVYIALGTTIGVAGSQAAFRQVDFDHVVQVARAARAAGASRLAVVSAMGADSNSRIFYNRVKGDMQDAIAHLGYESVVIAQPALLAGNRTALGQPVRSGEVWGLRVMHALRGVIPMQWRPIAAATVARAMVQATLRGEPGVHVLSSARMQSHAQ